MSMAEREKECRPQSIVEARNGKEDADDVLYHFERYSNHPPTVCDPVECELSPSRNPGEVVEKSLLRVDPT